MKKIFFSIISETIQSGRVTTSIVIINTVVFLLMFFLYNVFQIDLINVFAQYHPSHNSFRFYQILSSDFVHLNFLHLYNNMSLLLFFGISLENRIKPVNFLIFYLVSGIAAGLIQSSFVPERNTIGASGAVYAVFTFHLLYSCYYFSFLKINPKIDKMVNLALLLMLFMEMIIVISSITSDFRNLNKLTGVAHHAHLGGALFGLISFLIFAIHTKIKHPNFRLRCVYFEINEIEQENPVIKNETEIEGTQIG